MSRCAIKYYCSGITPTLGVNVDSSQPGHCPW